MILLAAVFDESREIEKLHRQYKTSPANFYKEILGLDEKCRTRLAIALEEPRVAIIACLLSLGVLVYPDQCWPIIPSYHFP
jgi:hypothetical protein